MTTNIQNPGGGSGAASYTSLFDANFLKKLERLSVISRKLRAGRPRRGPAGGWPRPWR